MRKTFLDLNILEDSPQSTVKINRWCYSAIVLHLWEKAEYYWINFHSLVIKYATSTCRCISKFEISPGKRNIKVKGSRIRSADKSQYCSHLLSGILKSFLMDSASFGKPETISLCAVSWTDRPTNSTSCFSSICCWQSSNFRCSSVHYKITKRERNSDIIGYNRGIHWLKKRLQNKSFVSLC